MQDLCSTYPTPKELVLDDADYTDHTDNTDHTDQGPICPERCRSCSGNISHIHNHLSEL